MQAAQSEAGKKGAAISAARSEEDRKAAGQKAAETRYVPIYVYTSESSTTALIAVLESCVPMIFSDFFGALMSSMFKALSYSPHNLLICDLPATLSFSACM